MGINHEPGKDKRLPTKDVLKQLQREVGIDGSLRGQLTDSLLKAQLESLQPPLTIVQQGDVIIYDPEDTISTQLSLVAFERRIEEVRRVRPVLYFNIPAIEAQKGEPIRGLT